jgi:hypothetical protein
VTAGSSRAGAVGEHEDPEETEDDDVPGATHRILAWVGKIETPTHFQCHSGLDRGSLGALPCLQLPGVLQRR